MTTYKLLFSSSKYRFPNILHPVELRKLHVAEAAWQQSRLLGTSAAREIPINSITKRKKISKLERKAMAIDYVNKYRSMNAGKFPTPSNVQKQVGGSYHTVKVIIQELQHNFKISALATATNSSTIGQTAQVNGTSDAEVFTGCQVSDHSIAVEEYGNTTESDISCGEVVDRNLYHKMVDMSNSNKNKEITADYLLGSEGKAFLESVRKQEKFSSFKEMSDDSINMKSQEVPVISSMVENTPSNQTVTTSDLELLAKPDHPSVATKRSEKSESADVDQAYTFESNEVTRGPTSQKAEDKKLQESSLWGNLKGFANNIINLWRKT